MGRPADCADLIFLRYNLSIFPFGRKWNLDVSTRIPAIRSSGFAILSATLYAQIMEIHTNTTATIMALVLSDREVERISSSSAVIAMIE